MFGTTPFRAIDERLDTPPLHPGEVLREDMLPHFRVSASELARHLQVPHRIVDALLSERGRVTEALAARLGAAFGQGAHYWLALQRQHDRWQHAIGEA